MNICILDLPVDYIGIESIKPSKYGQSNGNDSISTVLAEIDSVCMHTSGEHDYISPVPGKFHDFYENDSPFFDRTLVLDPQKLWTVYDESLTSTQLTYSHDSTDGHKS